MKSAFMFPIYLVSKLSPKTEEGNKQEEERQGKGPLPPIEDRSCYQEHKR